MSTEVFPHSDMHPHLRTLPDDCGAQRMFLGTDITRMQSSWLKGRDLKLLMGDAVAQWLRWDF